MNRTAVLLVASVAAAAVLSFAALSLGEPPATPPAPPAPAKPVATPAKDPLEAVAFLKGSWGGPADNGGFAEEIWSGPRSGSMMGAFRWLAASGKPAMFEMIAITNEESVVRLRLRHYTAILTAQEERDKPMTLRLAESKDGYARFESEKNADDLDGVIYQVKDNALHIDVLLKGAPEPLKFRLTRQ